MEETSLLPVPAKKCTRPEHALNPSTGNEAWEQSSPSFGIGEKRAVVSAQENRAIGNVKLVYMDSSGVGSLVYGWIYVSKKGKKKNVRFYYCELSLVEFGFSSHHLNVLWLYF